MTAGWLALSNGQLGLLLAENAETLSSMAFCPIRLHERDGIQHLSLNPSGSYYGKQPDYSHLGGNGLGAELATPASGALRPNAPSFNGQTLRFSLLLAPYAGKVCWRPAPPMRMCSKCSKGIVRSPLLAPIWRSWQRLFPPAATGANAPWQTQIIPPGHRAHIPDLDNGVRYVFQIRALAEGQQSEWTAEAECLRPGPVATVPLFSAASGISLKTMLKIVYYGLVHGLTTRGRR